MVQKKIIVKIADKGVITCFRIVLRYVKKHIFGIYRVIIFEQDIHKNHLPTKPPFDVSFKKAKKSDIMSLDNEEFAYTEIDKKYGVSRIEQGDTCIFIFDKKKIIGYTWVMYNQMELSPHNNIDISANRAYLYNIFILPLYRRKNITYVIDDYLFQRFKEQDIRFVVLTVDMDNSISMRNRRQAGFKRVGLIIKFRFFGLKYDYVSKKVKAYLNTPF